MVCIVHQGPRQTVQGGTCEEARLRQCMHLILIPAYGVAAADGYVTWTSGHFRRWRGKQDPARGDRAPQGLLTMFSRCFTTKLIPKPIRSATLLLCGFKPRKSNSSCSARYTPSRWPACGDSSVVLRGEALRRGCHSSGRPYVSVFVFFCMCLSV